MQTIPNIFKQHWILIGLVIIFLPLQALSYQPNSSYQATTKNNCSNLPQILSTTDISKVWKVGDTIKYSSFEEAYVIPALYASMSDSIVRLWFHFSDIKYNRNEKIYEVMGKTKIYENKYDIKGTFKIQESAIACHYDADYNMHRATLQVFVSLN